MSRLPGSRRGPARAAALGLVATFGMLVGAVPAGAAPAGPEVPEPPPVTGAPPLGDPPGPAAGLTAPSRCERPAADPDVGADLGGRAADRLRLGAVHRIATGANQVIAVIDTGVEPHERLGERLSGGGDYLTGGNGLHDCDGHGTAVAGILAAAPGDDGFVGMAPDAEVISIRQASPAYGVTVGGLRRPAGDVDTLAEAIVLAVRRGATVVNISLAVCLDPVEAANAGRRLQAALRHAAQHAVLVAAAGNIAPGSLGDGSCATGAGQVALPGWYDDLLTVAAVDPFDRPAPFTVPGPWVDLAAPGTALHSIAAGGGMRPADVEGTSFATPWVAGLAALVRERFPDLTPRQVADRLMATARPASGGTDAVGAGVIDPVAALTAEPEVLPRPVLVPDLTAAAALPGAERVAPGPGVPGWVLLPAPVVLLVAAVVGGAAVRTRPRPVPPGADPAAVPPRRRHPAPGALTGDR